MIFAFNVLMASDEEWWPYQSCPTENQHYTRRISQQANQFHIRQDRRSTTGIFCLIDYEFTGGSWREWSLDMGNISDLHRISYGMIIPRECFLAAALRVKFPPHRLSYCDYTGFPKKVPLNSSLASHCVNEDYIDMIWKSFAKMSYCFNSTQEEAEHFFRVINHESSFILNVMSSTGARCLGQVTRIYVKDGNRRIGLSEDGLVPFPVYDEAVKRCPELKDKTVLDDLDD